MPRNFEGPCDSPVSDDPGSANELGSLFLAADDDSSSDGKTKADVERSFVDRLHGEQIFQ